MTDEPPFKEETSPHTGLLRLGLVVEQSQIFWCRAGQERDARVLAEQASRQEWFQDTSDSRSRYLVQQLSRRFPPECRAELARSPDLQASLVCHWHLQLTDPLYRLYTGEYLMERWSSPTQSVSLEGSNEWARKQAYTFGWRPNTVRRLASGLLSSATEAGLCRRSGRRERELRLPRVESRDREYLTSLLEKAGALGSRSMYLLPVGLGSGSLTEEGNE